MLDDDEALIQTTHCGRAGCECAHFACDRGWVPARSRIEHTQVTVDGVKVDKTIEWERVRPCAECKPETYEEARRAPTRKDFLRRARRLRTAK